MPGVIRNGRKQFLIETNTGFASWAEWKDYVESITDDLPDFEGTAPEGASQEASTEGGN